MPYLSCARFELSVWLPASILLSSIAPMIEVLRAYTCRHRSFSGVSHSFSRCERISTDNHHISSGLPHEDSAASQLMGVALFSGAAPRSILRLWRGSLGMGMVPYEIEGRRIRRCPRPIELSGALRLAVRFSQYLRAGEAPPTNSPKIDRRRGGHRNWRQREVPADPGETDLGVYGSSRTEMEFAREMIIKSPKPGANATQVPIERD